jgi:hypothetical protein
VYIEDKIDAKAMFAKFRGLANVIALLVIVGGVHYPGDNCVRCLQLGSARTFTTTTPHPSLYTVAPVAATCVLCLLAQTSVDGDTTKTSPSVFDPVSDVLFIECVCADVNGWRKHISF